MTATITKTKTQLTETQRSRKAELEGQIGKHIESFKLCGEALAEIHKDKLYLDEHDTFEEYCEEKWGMSRRRGYQLIESAETAKSCEPLVHIPNERVAREISKLPKTKDKIAAAKILKKARVINSSTAAAAVQTVKARGGLAEAVKNMERQNKGQEVIDVVPNEPEKPTFSPETKKAIVDAIDSWYAPKRNFLNTYPTASPDRVVQLIKALFL